jgi:hypothetical protein
VPPIALEPFEYTQLSKIEAGQLVLELSDYTVQDIVQIVHSTLEPLAADKKLAFKVDVAPDLPHTRLRRDSTAPESALPSDCHPDRTTMLEAVTMRLGENRTKKSTMEKMRHPA